MPLVYSLSDNAIQAFSYENRFFGVLFHMEMTPEMIRELLKKDKTWFEKEDRKINHGNNAQAIMQKAAELETQMDRQAEKLFSNFERLRPAFFGASLSCGGRASMFIVIASA